MSPPVFFRTKNARIKGVDMCNNLCPSHWSFDRGFYLFRFHANSPLFHHHRVQHPAGPWYFYTLDPGSFISWSWRGSTPRSRSNGKWEVEKCEIERRSRGAISFTNQLASGSGFRRGELGPGDSVGEVGNGEEVQKRHHKEVMLTFCRSEQIKTNEKNSKMRRGVYND